MGAWSPLGCLLLYPLVAITFLCHHYALTVTYAIYRQYERSDSRFFSIIKDRFDSEGGITPGFHVTQ